MTPLDNQTLMASDALLRGRPVLIPADPEGFVFLAQEANPSAAMAPWKALSGWPASRGWTSADLWWSILAVLLRGRHDSPGRLTSLLGCFMPGRNLWQKVAPGRPLMVDRGPFAALVMRLMEEHHPSVWELLSELPEVPYEKWEGKLWVPEISILAPTGRKTLGGVVRTEREVRSGNTAALCGLRRTAGREAAKTEVWNEVEHLRSRVARQPNEGRLRVRLAQFLADEGRFEEAAGEYRAALERSPGNASWRVSLARVLRRAGQNDEAEKELRRILSSSPDCVKALVELGLLLVSTERLGEAVAVYRCALQHCPRSPWIHNNLGCALYALERFKAAEQAFKNAVRCDPDFRRAWLNLGHSLLRSKQFCAAERAYSKACEGPTKGEASCYLGLAALLSGKPYKARKALREGLALVGEGSPMVCLASDWLAMACRRCRRGRKAASNLDRSQSKA